MRTLSPVPRCPRCGRHMQVRYQYQAFIGVVDAWYGCARCDTDAPMPPAQKRHHLSPAAPEVP